MSKRQKDVQARGKEKKKDGLSFAKPLWRIKRVNLSACGFGRKKRAPARALSTKFLNARGKLL